ncbi:MAG TPA: penicillin acylase family protein, partial [Balneolales bacterium]|nr:penicillin acylase family protein [Balneolales bacterium]
ENKLPIEFSLTGIKPMKWTVTNTLALARMFAWQLNVSWWSETTYSYLANKLPAYKMKQLYPTWPDSIGTTLNRQETHDLSSVLMPMVKQEFGLRRRLHESGTHVGSNAWVVDGSKTNSGFPLLAGDPHLGLSIPDVWYEVSLNLNGRHLSGATRPGEPFILVGQNDFMAWSLTNLMADDTDFFLEQVDPNDRGRYVSDSLHTVDTTKAVYKNFKVDNELIKTKSGAQIVLRIRMTDHGPVISDIFPDKKLLDGKVVSMDWTGYDMSDELNTFMKINWAKSFEQFKQALPTFGVPAQNFMYADKSGNIAMFSAGKIPIRKHNPILFRKGWDPSYNWQGFIPFKKMPHVINPKKGWIANANNRVTSRNYPYYISTFWEPPSRFETITHFLKTHNKFTVGDFKQLQTSSFSSQAKMVTQKILPILESDSQDSLIAKAIPYLKNWDYRYKPSETAASIFDTFFMDFSKNTLQDDMGKTGYHDFIRLESLPVRVMDHLLMVDSTQTSDTTWTKGSPLFDNINTPTVETKRDMILKSMRQAVTFLSDSLGSKPYKWRWENLHTITFEPPLLGKAAKRPNASKALKLIVNNILSSGPYPADGDGLTVNNGQYSWLHPYQMVLGPSIRRIVDFSDLKSTYTVLPTGQSGNPLSDHYDDQVQLWLNGQYRKLSQDPSLTLSQPHKTMILNPATQ